MSIKSLSFGRFCWTLLQVTFLTLLLLFFLSMTMKSKIHGVQKPELQEILDFTEWPLISWTLFYRSDSKLRERELHRICNFSYSVAPSFPVYDGEEYNSWGTGAEASEDFPDSVAADSSDYDAGEEYDPWAAGARAPRDSWFSCQWWQRVWLMGNRSWGSWIFPDSVAADSSDYDAGEEPDPWAAGARAPGDGPGREQAGRLSQRPQEQLKGAQVWKFSSHGFF